MTGRRVSLKGLEEECPADRMLNYVNIYSWNLYTRDSAIQQSSLRWLVKNPFLDGLHYLGKQLRPSTKGQGHEMKTWLECGLPVNIFKTFGNSKVYGVKKMAQNHVNSVNILGRSYIYIYIYKYEAAGTAYQPLCLAWRVVSLSL